MAFIIVIFQSSYLQAYTLINREPFWNLSLSISSSKAESYSKLSSFELFSDSLVKLSKELLLLKIFSKTLSLFLAIILEPILSCWMSYALVDAAEYKSSWMTSFSAPDFRALTSTSSNMKESLQLSSARSSFSMCYSKFEKSSPFKLAKLPYFFNSDGILGSRFWISLRSYERGMGSGTNAKSSVETIWLLLRLRIGNSTVASLKDSEFSSISFYSRGINGSKLSKLKNVF